MMMLRQQQTVQDMCAGELVMEGSNFAHGAVDVERSCSRMVRSSQMGRLAMCSRTRSSARI